MYVCIMHIGTYECITYERTYGHTYVCMYICMPNYASYHTFISSTNAGKPPIAMKVRKAATNISIAPRA